MGQRRGDRTGAVERERLPPARDDDAQPLPERSPLPRVERASHDA